MAIYVVEGVMLMRSCLRVDVNKYLWLTSVGRVCAVFGVSVLCMEYRWGVWSIGAVHRVSVLCIE